ncbi:MAG: S41 family peptidase [Flavobacteriia bacterium]|nr:S41 family peptidase [Flavobacteriia bacterium]
MKYILTSIFVIVSITITLAQSNPATVSTNQKFNEVLMYINKLYVDSVNDKQLTDAAIVAMLEKLDPHSVYISKEEVDDANMQIEGSFVGIGIRFQILKDTLMVVATIPGGPSEKLGILAGDKIVKVEDKNIAGIGLKTAQVREHLLGELGSKVRIEVIRKNAQKPLNYLITRDKIPLNSVDCYYMVTPETGYIKLNSFSRSTVDEIHKSIKELKNKGMKNLIFDLQGNGGGLLYAAQKVADEFLNGDKLIVYSEGRSQPRTDYKSGEKGNWEKGTLIILTDEYSASASEIVSGAIQDWDRGLIIGRRTYGKGLVQRPIDLTDGSQMRLTIARYYTPAGRFIQKPYDDVDEYRKDLSNRYKNGEFQHADSIHLPDSLKHLTLLTKRTVYNGGGIMPDVFVPLDTMEITDYYRDLVQGGHINSFSLTYVNENRDAILKQYPTFAEFKLKFTNDEKFMKSFFDYVQKEDVKLEYNDKEYKISEKLIQLRLKAYLAQDIWGYNEFYEIYNDTNEALIKALEVLKNNQYEKMNLDNGKN